MDNRTRTLVRRAQNLLRRGDPLPVDLTARLLEAGIDVTALERAPEPSHI